MVCGRNSLALVLVAMAVSANAATLGQRSLRPTAALVETRVGSASASEAVLQERIRDFRAANPLFSEESCTGMFATKKKLGGPVPPNDFVVGCTEVCDMVKQMKDYWGSGEAATFACEHAAGFGCVWEGTPPVTAADIGC